MRVLLGLGRVQLAIAALCQHLRDRRLGPRLLERDRVVPVLLIARHRRRAHDRAAASVELGESGLAECADQLAHPVGPEVERHHAVAFADRGRLADDRRLDELVRLVAPVGHLRCSRRAVRPQSIGVHERVVRALGAVPAPVAVHAPVATHHRADARGHVRLRSTTLRPARGSRVRTSAACPGRR